MGGEPIPYIAGWGGDGALKASVIVLLVAIVCGYDAFANRGLLPDVREPWA